MDYMSILKNVVYVLIFPGLLFTAVFGLWLAGVDRKMVARMQKRIGPPLMQPAYDFFKLLGKETILPDNAARLTFTAAPYVGLVSLVVTVLLIPLAGFQVFGGVADVVVILYLLTIPSLALIFGGSASGSPYAGVGISRQMVTIMAYELPLIIILLAVGRLAGRGYDMGVTFSLGQMAEFQAANGPNIFHWSMIPAALAMLFVIPCEVGAHPFDVGEAETEICEGPLVEYSGAPLAVFKLSHAIKMFVMTALFTALFLGGITTGMLWLDIIIVLVICTLVTIISMSLAHAITARLKVEQVFKFYWTVVTGLALISLILVWIGV